MHPLQVWRRYKIWEEGLRVQSIALPSDGSCERENTARNLIKYKKGKCEVLQVQARQRRSFSPLLSPSGMLCPVLGCPVEETYGNTEAGP